MANWNNRWTKEHTFNLEQNLDLYGWDVHKLPLTTLAHNYNRTEAAVIAKAKRLVEKYNRTYEWSEPEQNGAFHYYLKGLPLKEIHEKLVAFGSGATIEQLEGEMLRMKKVHEQAIRAYAEERKLPVAKALSIDTINYFLQNKNTESSFVRKALHARIAKNG